jgi:hypothetical protein
VVVRAREPYVMRRLRCLFRRHLWQPESSGNRWVCSRCGAHVSTITDAQRRFEKKVRAPVGPVASPPVATCDGGAVTVGAVRASLRARIGMTSGGCSCGAYGLFDSRPVSVVFAGRAGEAAYHLAESNARSVS